MGVTVCSEVAIVRTVLGDLRELGHRGALDPGDLHLAAAEQLPDIVLREILVEPEVQHAPLGDGELRQQHVGRQGGVKA